MQISLRPSPPNLFSIGITAYARNTQFRSHSPDHAGRIAAPARIPVAAIIFADTDSDQRRPVGGVYHRKTGRGVLVQSRRATLAPGPPPRGSGERLLNRPDHAWRADKTAESKAMPGIARAGQHVVRLHHRFAGNDQDCRASSRQERIIPTSRTMRSWPAAAIRLRRSRSGACARLKPQDKFPGSAADRG